MDLVVKLYKRFAYTSAIQSPMDEPVFADMPRAVLQTYLTPQLVQFVLGDRQCRVASGLICKLDFDLLFGSQDPVGSYVDILPTADSDKVKVEVHGAGGAPSTALVYSLTLTDQGWRIRDIAYPDRESSLQQILGPK